jgi:hypothetical protein
LVNNDQRGTTGRGRPRQDDGLDGEGVRGGSCKRASWPTSAVTETKRVTVTAGQETVVEFGDRRPT